MQTEPISAGIISMMTKKEAKRKAFQRLATKRTNAVLNRIRILGNCSNPRLYDYTEADVMKILEAIDSEIKVLKARFMNSNKSMFQL